MAFQVDIGFTDDDRWIAGSTRRFTIPVVDADGAPKDLTGATSADWRLTDLTPIEGTPAILLEKGLGSGVEVIDTLAGEITITLSAADSQNLAPGDYYYEVRMVDGTADAESVTYGYARLSATVFSA